jgi:hypothetical protein
LNGSFFVGFVDAILFFGSMWFLDNLRLCLLDLLEILKNKKENCHQNQQKGPINSILI